MHVVSALSEDHELYFLPDAAAVLVPLHQLQPTKAPDSQPESVDRAEELMRRAGAGATGRRAPISVAPTSGGYTVLDGNATYGVALRHGWATLPALVKEDPGP
jgi:hypothetical protein